MAEVRRSIRNMASQGWNFFKEHIGSPLDVAGLITELGQGAREEIRTQVSRADRDAFLAFLNQLPDQDAKNNLFAIHKQLDQKDEGGWPKSPTDENWFVTVLAGHRARLDAQGFTLAQQNDQFIKLGLAAATPNAEVFWQQFSMLEHRSIMQYVYASIGWFRRWWYGLDGSEISNEWQEQSRQWREQRAAWHAAQAELPEPWYGYWYRGPRWCGRRFLAFWMRLEAWAERED
jgi:hypothetical protein